MNASRFVFPLVVLSLLALAVSVSATGLPGGEAGVWTELDAAPKEPVDIVSFAKNELKNALSSVLENPVEGSPPVSPDTIENVDDIDVCALGEVDGLYDYYDYVELNPRSNDYGEDVGGAMPPLPQDPLIDEGEQTDGGAEAAASDGGRKLQQKGWTDVGYKGDGKTYFVGLRPDCTNDTSVPYANITVFWNSTDNEPGVSLFTLNV